MTDQIARERIDALGKFLERVIEERTAAQATALRIQSTEVARRLDGLNNEADRLQKAVAANVSNDTWVAFFDRYEERHKSLEWRLLRAESFQAKLLGAYGLMLLLMPLVFIVISHLLK